MWHASVNTATQGQAELMARSALNGVGDASLGEWVENGHGHIVHLRRRLSEDEESVIGPAVDIRGTPEEERRMDTLFDEVPYLRPGWR